MSAVRDVVEVVARALTDNPDQVRVTESQHKVIGKQGRTAAALRTLASTAGEKDGRTVTLEIRDGKP